MLWLDLYASGKRIEDSFLPAPVPDRRGAFVSRPKLGWYFVRHREHHGTSNINIVWMTPWTTHGEAASPQPTFFTHHASVRLIDSGYHHWCSYSTVTSVVTLSLVCCPWLQYIIATMNKPTKTWRAIGIFCILFIWCTIADTRDEDLYTEVMIKWLTNCWSPSDKIDKNRKGQPESADQYRGTEQKSRLPTCQARLTDSRPRVMQVMHTQSTNHKALINWRCA